MSLYGLSPLQLLLLLGSCLGFLAVMYLLRRPPRVLPVSSTLLWRRALEQRKKRAPDYLRRLLSWFLVSMVAGAAILALADPELHWLRPGRRQLHIVVANHPSMLATDSRGVRRWDAALDQVRLLLQGESPASRIVLETTGRRSPERRPLQPIETLQLLNELRIDFSTPSTFPPPVAGSDRVLFYTDGTGDLPTPEGVETVSVYVPLQDVSVESLAITPAPDAPLAVIEVANLGDQPGQFRVNLSDTAGHSKVEALTLEGGQKASLSSRLEGFEPGPVVASLAAWRDSLELDDRRFDWLFPGRRRVLLAGDRNRSLETLLALYPELEVEYLGKPDDLNPEGGDVLILENWAPAGAPTLPFLLLGTPQADWLPPPRARHAGTNGLQVDPEHPLTRGLELPDLQVRSAGDVQSEDLRTLVGSDGGSLLVLRDGPSPQVQLTFLPRDSNLERHPAFAILIENFLTWTRNRQLLRVSLGEIEVAPGSRVFDPDGVELELRPGLERDRVELRKPGIYSALTPLGRLQIVANPDPVQLPASPPPRALPEAPAPAEGGFEWWRLLLGLGLFFGLFEWALYHRRLTV